MTVLAVYQALAPGASKSTVSAALDAATNAPLTAVNDTDRAALIQLLIDDIVSARASQPSRLSSKDIPQALGAIKSLGRVEAGSRVISTQENLRHFLAFASDLSAADASKQAMRCIANALLLIPAGRDNFVEVEGDEFCTRLLINDNSSAEYLFLASRLLFFMSHTDGEFISRVVRQHRLPNLLALRLDTLGSAVLNDTPLAKDALSDMLKLHFTVVAKYARLVGEDSNAILGEYWDEVFEPTAVPLVRLLHTLPSTPTNPLAAPLTYVIHALLNVPIAPYAHIWFSDSSTQASNSSPRTSRSSSSGAAQSPRPSFGADKPIPGGSAIDSPTSGGSGGGSPFTRALNLLNRRSSPARSSKASAPQDSALRVLSLLSATLAVYFPGNTDVDDNSLRNLARARGVVVDELVPPVAVLLTRLVGDVGARARVSAVIFPADLDRSSPLEKKDDFLGRCIRLMTSVYHHTLKDAIGEMLFTICGSDGQALSAAIGYGNSAGFLYNKGIMAPPPASAGGEDVNPITGTTEPQSGPNLSEMTDEEKEREAERLFVLFDRMERMGMAKNPIREAYQSGRFQD
ncbi:hypothetical protein BDV93DRAFT_523195 [Ceratobasidium sp. AG-I]|nr:hypothetical protein BDV93DRAFT_523195 [Ceratobasidium sp. AG-I]